MAGIKNDPRPKGTKEPWGTSISRPHGYSENSEPNGYWYATEKLVPSADIADGTASILRRLSIVIASQVE